MIKKDMYFKHNASAYRAKWQAFFHVLKKDKEKDCYICNSIEILPNNMVRFSVRASRHKCVLTKEISKDTYEQERNRAYEILANI